MTSLRLGSVISAFALVLATGAAQAQNADTPGIDKRQANQEKRIDQGIASGELTKREARRLERQQNRIDRAEAAAKADGKVTKKERAGLHHMQDKASANIAHQKHDAQKRGAQGN